MIRTAGVFFVLAILLAIDFVLEVARPLTFSYWKRKYDGFNKS